MFSKLKLRPSIEMLEDRTCPALTLRLVPGMLTISGTPTTDLTITGTGTLFQVKDGTANLGSYSFSNLLISLKSYKAPLTLDLNDQTIGGNVTIARGVGNTSAVIDSNPITILDGRVGGSITVTGGSGNELFELGKASAGDELIVGGSVNVSGKNGAIGDGDDVRLRGGSRVGGNLSVLGPRLQIGETLAAGSVVGGSVSINAATGNKELNLAINGATVIGKNVSATGSSALAALGDVIQVESTASVLGSFYSNLGNNLNFWLLDGTINGNVTLQGGTGTDVMGVPVNFLLLGTTGLTVGGSFNYTATGGSTGFTFNPTAVVLGNMTLNMGNGDADLGGGVYSGAFQGSVAGNLNITLGNGTNFALIESVPGGKFNWTSGNGVNTLVLGSALTPPSTWNVNIRFGTGADTFTLANAGGNAQVLTGYVNGGGGVTTFSQDVDWTLSSLLTLIL